MKCKFCNHLIHPEALRCIACMRWLDGRPETPAMRDEQPSRPLSVTIAAWLVFIGTIYSLWLGTQLAPQSGDKTFSTPALLIGACFHVSIAVYLLAGVSWSRVYLLAVTPVFVLLSAGIDLWPVVVGLLGYGLLAFLLTRSTVNEYFEAGEGREALHSPPLGGHAGSH